MLMCGCAVFSLTSCSKKEQVKEEVVQYTVINPVIKDTTFTKDYVAQIQSLQNVEIRAQEKGYLETLHVDEGANVKSGQVLFNIMPKLYEADFLKSKADAKIATLELQNVKTLADKNNSGGHGERQLDEHEQTRADREWRAAVAGDREPGGFGNEQCHSLPHGQHRAAWQCREKHRH